MLEFAVVAGLAAVLLVWAILIYNRFVMRRQQTKEGWSGIDVQLKRRANLIPNLLETVQIYASHERELLDDLTRLRSRSLESEDAPVGARADLEGKLGGALMQLFAVAENYPDLKANQNYLSLQENLNEIEDQIQMARRYYNGAVRNLNILVDSFPSNLVARFFGFIKEPYYEIDSAGDRALPKISGEMIT